MASKTVSPISRKRSQTLQIKWRYLINNSVESEECGVAVLVPESEAEGETVHKTLEEPADAVNARVRLLLLQVSVKLVQFGHQDLINTVSNQL